MLSRRDLLHAGCAATIVTLVPNFLDVAEAAFHHGAIPSGFNGGRSQVNLNAVQTGGDYVFLNQVLNSGFVSLGDNSGSPSPNDLNSNGYPLPGSDAIVNRSGIKSVGFIPALYNASPIHAVQVTGKGQLFGFGTVQTIAITGAISAPSPKNNMPPIHTRAIIDAAKTGAAIAANMASAKPPIPQIAKSPVKNLRPPVSLGVSSIIRARQGHAGGYCGMRSLSATPGDRRRGVTAKRSQRARRGQQQREAKRSGG
jgi:hypothetical protein